MLALLQNGGTNSVQRPLNPQRRVSSDPKDGVGFNSNSNLENGWRLSKQNPFPTRNVGDISLQTNGDHPRNDIKSHKIPLLPDPPMAKGETGLLPTPDSGQNNHVLGRAKPACALRNNGHHVLQNSGGFLEAPVSHLQHSPPKTSLLGPKPQSFVGLAPKVPLLGDKPSNVKNCLRQTSPTNNTSQDLTEDPSNTGRLPLGSVTLTSPPLLPDTNGALQQIIPLILNQQQQMMYHELTKPSPQLPPVSSLPPTLHPAPPQRNLTSPPSQPTIVNNGTIPMSLPNVPNGNGLIYNPANASTPHSPSNINFGSLSQLQQQLQLQGLPSAFVGLLMQMSSQQGMDVLKGCNGDVRQAALAVSQQQCQPPGTIIKGGLQGMLNGGGGGGYSQLYGQLAGFLSSPPNPSRPMFMNPLPSLASLVTLANGGKPSMTGFTPPQFMIPQNPPNVNQLMADIQQRGSLLGDFWQVAVAQGDFPPIFAHPCGGKLPVLRPTVSSLSKSS